MDASFKLQDLFDKIGILHNDILLVRHAKHNKHCQWHLQNSAMKEYTLRQGEKFPTNYKYIMSFVSSDGSTAVFDKLYKVESVSKQDSFSDEYKIKCPYYTKPNGVDIFFDLKDTYLLQYYENKLVLDWGLGTRKWFQSGKNIKEILAIYPIKTIAFCGYENVLLKYHELKEIIENEILYADWHVALKSVNAIYLITNTSNGKIYVGSAYGQGGLLERWRCYVQSFHGNNKGIMQELAINCDEFHNFQFSVLRILSKSMSDKEIIEIESNYKNKLLSINFGMNKN